MNVIHTSIAMMALLWVVSVQAADPLEAFPPAEQAQVRYVLELPAADGGVSAEWCAGEVSGVEGRRSVGRAGRLL